jgi:hypothetical protein
MHFRVFALRHAPKFRPRCTSRAMRHFRGAAH